MSQRRIFVLLPLGFLWTVLCVSLAIAASKDTGQLSGMVAGSLMSFVAFVPPALLFNRWFQQQNRRDPVSRDGADHADDTTDGPDGAGLVTALDVGKAGQPGQPVAQVRTAEPEM